MTVLQLITRSLRMIRQLGPGRSASATEVADALGVLNSLVDSLNAERTTVYNILRSTHTLTPSLNPHTIGASGTFDTTRPARVERAGLIAAGSTEEIPLHVYRSAQEWAARGDKSGSGEPVALYYEPSYPLAKLHLYPVPASAATLVLYGWSPISQFATSADTVSFPPGYEDMLASNLAVRLGPEWERPVRPETAELARTSLQKVRSMNAPAPTLECDPAMLRGGHFDILRGDWR
jgi:hypothetical protein